MVALVGVEGQIVREVADQLHGRLVAGDDQQEAEAQQLIVREQPVALGFDQETEHVVSRRSAVLGDPLVEVGVDVEKALLAGLGNLVDAIVPQHQRVGTVQQEVSIPRRNREQLADHRHGQQAGEVRHQVRVPGAGKARDEALGQRADGAFEFEDAAPGPAPVDDGAHTAVVRLVHAHEHWKGEVADVLDDHAAL
jgi:hypothetical protein